MPPFTVTGDLESMGSEYCFIGLGMDVVGVYSLTTGREVRQLKLVEVIQPLEREGGEMKEGKYVGGWLKMWVLVLHAPFFFLCMLNQLVE